MAATNTGARFAYNLAGRTSGIFRKMIIANSKTVTIGDFVHTAAGFLDIAATGETLLGVVVGVVDANGIGLDNTKVSLDGTWTSSTHTYAAASDNQTVLKVCALVDVDPFSVWSCEPDATIGTTTGSNLAGYYTDLADEDEIDESTAHVTTKSQLYIWGVDPEDSTRGLYSIAEHEIWAA